MPQPHFLSQSQASVARNVVSQIYDCDGDKFKTYLVPLTLNERAFISQRRARRRMEAAETYHAEKAYKDWQDNLPVYYMQAVDYRKSLEYAALKHVVKSHSHSQAIAITKPWL